MKAGQFNINDYLEKLNEAAEGGQLPNKEGLIIPEENQKSFQWLKKEYQKAQTEVKVEINMGGTKFEPGYDLQTDLKSVKDFKPGMFGEVKTADTKEDVKKPTNTVVNDKQQKSSSEKPEEQKAKEDKFKTKDQPQNIKDKEDKKQEEPEEKEEEKEEPEEKDDDKKGDVKVKKMDLKTKK